MSNEDNQELKSNIKLPLIDENKVKAVVNCVSQYNSEKLEKMEFDLSDDIIQVLLLEMLKQLNVDLYNTTEKTTETFLKVFGQDIKDVFEGNKLKNHIDYSHLFGDMWFSHFIYTALQSAIDRHEAEHGPIKPQTKNEESSDIEEE